MIRWENDVARNVKSIKHIPKKDEKRLPPNVKWSNGIRQKNVGLMVIWGKWFTLPVFCGDKVKIIRKLHIGKTNIRKLQEKWKKTIWRVTSQNTRLMVIRQVFGGGEEVFSVEGKPWEKYFLWDKILGWASTNWHLVIIRQGLLGGSQWPCSFIFSCFGGQRTKHTRYQNNRRSTSVWIPIGVLWPQQSLTIRHSLRSSESPTQCQTADSQIESN